MSSPLPVVSSAAPAGPSAGRMAYLDNLKILLIVLVVAHHAAQAYGPTGGSWPVGQDERAEVLGPFITINSMFFMGLFFFISGYFTPHSVERKGLRRFVVDRLLRFGLPALAWLPIHRLTDGSWGWEFAHLWFLVDLLGLNLLYAAWCVLFQRPARRPVPHIAGRPPGNGLILCFVLLLGALTALVRIEYPVDRWIRFLGVFPMEPAHWPQYLGLFILGLWAWRTRWLEHFSAAQGRGWVGVAVIAAAFYTAYRLIPRPFEWFSTGGLHWQTESYATFEALTCVAFCVGLLWLFRDHLNRGSAWLRALAADAYGIYWVHMILVVGAQFALRSAPLGPLGKFFVVTIAGFLASWAISHFVLRLGWLGRKVF